MNNEKMPKGNQNKAPSVNSSAPRHPQIPQNAAQKKTPNTRNAAPHSRPQQKRPEPNVSFAATPKKSTPRTPQKMINATQKIHAAPPRIEPRIPKKDNSVTEEKPRRRNDESYVFSRSLSETRERILEERRERLEDAKKFQKEDVRLKLRAGIIAFVAIILLVSIIASIAISCSLGSNKPKKSRGEYVYTIGTKELEVGYADAVRHNVLYIRMNDVAELCEMTLSGSSSTELRFTAKSGDWIAFSPSSSSARINGYSISMPHPAYIQDTSCSVPLEFIEFVLEGISVSVDLENKEIKLLRKEYSDSTPLEPHYVEVSFGLRTDSILTPLDENKYFAGQPLFTFKNDLSEYEKYMNPSDESKKAFLILLNKENPCGPDFEPSDLTVIPDKWVNPEKVGSVTLDLNKTAYKALEAMLIEMRSEGFSDVYVTSAYRPYSYQSALFNTYIDKEMAKNPSLTREEAAKIVETYSAIPGYSEHHTGLCVDLITTDMVDLTNIFADKEVFDWLRANAWKFGFILRYPEDKVDITGYSYESWHWRFVGRDVALEMLRTGECFEEYLTRTTTAE